jgi:hypothetical protein
VINFVASVGMLIAAALLARRNVRANRADRRTRSVWHVARHRHLRGMWDGTS